MAEQHSYAEKPSISQTEDIEGGKASRDIMHGDRALALIGDQHVVLTEEDVSFTSSRDNSATVPTKAPFPQNKRIRRKTDKVILVILVWVYFLQVYICLQLGNTDTIY